MYFFIYISVVFLMLFCGCIIIHISQTKEFTDIYGYGNYLVFKKEFEKYKWSYDKNWKSSLFDYDTDSKLHAGIIKFNGKGMLLWNPIDLIRALSLIRKGIKKCHGDDKKIKNFKWL